MFRKVSLSHPQDTNWVFGSLHSQFGPSQDQNEVLSPSCCESDCFGPSAAAGLTAFMAASGPKQSDSQHSGDKTSFWSFDGPNWQCSEPKTKFVSFDEPNWLYSALKLSILQVHCANKNFHQKNQSKTKKLKSKWWQCFSTLELRVIREFRPKKRPFYKQVSNSLNIPSVIKCVKGCVQRKIVSLDK